MDRTFPTGAGFPRDVIYLTLLNLPFRDLLSACQTNRAYRSVCQSDIFWRDYLDYFYGWNLVDTIYDSITNDDGSNTVVAIPVTIQPHSAAYNKNPREIAKLLDQILITLNRYQVFVTVRALPLWFKYLSLEMINKMIEYHADDADFMGAELPNTMFDNNETNYPSNFRLYSRYPFTNLEMYDKGYVGDDIESIGLKNLTSSGKRLFSEALRSVSMATDYWVPQNGPYPERRAFNFDIDRWQDITSILFELPLPPGVELEDYNKLAKLIAKNLYNYGQMIILRDNQW